MRLPFMEDGVLTVGCDAAAPLPLHSDINSPHFEGFEVDMMRKIADDLGFKIKYKSAFWSQIMDDLLTGRIDLICSAATITQERKALVDFGEPYLDIQLAMVVASQSAIQSVKQLEGKTVGVRIATSAEELVRTWPGLQSVQTFDFNTDAYLALQRGIVDAVIDDSPIAKAFAQREIGSKIGTLLADTDAQYAMVFRKGNRPLRETINEALRRIRQDGTYDALYQKWFGQPLTDFTQTDSQAANS